MSALILAANGTEDIELVTVIDILARASISVQIAVPSPDLKIVCARGTRILADLCLLSSSSEKMDERLLSFDILVIPGGLEGVQHLCENTVALSLVAHYASRLLAAICAGPLLVAKAKVLQGSTLACYPSLADRLTAEGYHVNREAKGVRDGNLLTSQGPATAMSFSLDIVAAMKSEQEAETVAQHLLYQR